MADKKLEDIYSEGPEVTTNWGAIFLTNPALKLRYFPKHRIVENEVILSHHSNIKLNYLLHKAESFLRSQTVLSYSRNSLYFLKPEGSLPHSQAPNTCPYTEPEHFSPCLPNLIENPFEYYLPIYA